MTAFELFFGERPNWKQIENVFFYLLSFGGPLPPRINEYDLGIEPLTIHIGPRRQLFVCPCRAVNGCQRHEAFGSAYQPGSMTELETRVAELEVHARSQSLTGEFGRCLLEGPCSERTFGRLWMARHPHANVPPWEPAKATKSSSTG